MTKNKDVLGFIARFTENGKRQEVIECFTCGCCYWFANILWHRFAMEHEDVAIVYDDIANHWACRVAGRVYDITGDITDKYTWQDWTKYRRVDNLHTRRLMRDCINFGGEENALV